MVTCLVLITTGCSPKTYQLSTSVNPSNSGSISPSDGNFHGEVILFETPAQGYEFSGWTGDASGNSNPLTLTMDSDKQVVAQFSQIIVTPTPTPLEVSIVSVTTPVNAGANATLVAQTAPSANCSIEVIYASGPSSASGLNAKQSDSSGKVSWTWKVGANTTPGNWQIIVTVSYNGNTVTQSTYFTVR